MAFSSVNNNGTRRRRRRTPHTENVYTPPTGHHSLGPSKTSFPIQNLQPHIGIQVYDEMSNAISHPIGLAIRCDPPVLWQFLKERKKSLSSARQLWNGECAVAHRPLYTIPSSLFLIFFYYPVTVVFFPLLHSVSYLADSSCWKPRKSLCASASSPILLSSRSSYCSYVVYLWWLPTIIGSICCSWWQPSTAIVIISPLFFFFFMLLNDWGTQELGGLFALQTRENLVLYCCTAAQW